MANEHLTTLKGAYDVEYMEVTLRVQRYDGGEGRRRYDTFTVEVPTTATLLDALDAVKDRHDGTLAYRKSCRMAVCGSCGMRMDGGAVLACKMPMKGFVEAGHVPTVAPMGNLPVIKDLVVDMAPFWHKIRAVKPWLDTRGEEAGETEWRVTPQQSQDIAKETLCIMCGCCVSECNSMEADPDFLGPAALAKAYRFVGDVRDLDTRNRLRDLNGAHGIWDCTRCYFCNQRCPKGVDPRDAIAKLGAESFREGITHDEGAKHAKVFIGSTHKGGFLRETELVPKTIGPIAAVREVPFALQLARAGKVPNPLMPHKAKDNAEVKRLWKLLESQADREPERAQRAPAAPSDGDGNGAGAVPAHALRGDGSGLMRDGRPLRTGRADLDATTSKES
jgi:succinate dehydrogenase / fumarate reductase iron-sulfur subunit